MEHENDATALEALLQALKDEEDTVREHVAKALGRIGYHYHPTIGRRVVKDVDVLVITD